MACRAFLMATAGLMAWSGSARGGPLLMACLPSLLLSSCHRPNAQITPPRLESFRGAGQVEVVDGGIVCVGLGAAAEDENAATWFLLTPGPGDIVLVDTPSGTWVATPAEGADFAAAVGAGAVVRSVPPQPPGAAHTVFASWSGRVDVRQADDGAVNLKVTDAKTGKIFRARFWVVPEVINPGQVQDQTTSCSAQCNNGQCSVTCIGKQADCGCRGGDPYCRCGAKLGIELLPPPMPA